MIWETVRITYKAARRIVVALVGFTVLLIGVALLVLPGPAFVVIPVGLGILGLEFAWARRWLRAAKEKGSAAFRWGVRWRSGASDGKDDGGDQGDEARPDTSGPFTR